MLADHDHDLALAVKNSVTVPVFPCSDWQTGEARKKKQSLLWPERRTLVLSPFLRALDRLILALALWPHRPPPPPIFAVTALHSFVVDLAFFCSEKPTFNNGFWLKSVFEIAIAASAGANTR
jgi:hypothetical protein